MPNIVWIYGSSAAGKETFLHNLLDRKIPHIKNHFQWNDKNFFVIKESINYIWQFANDPITEKRREILDKVLNLSYEKDSTIFIKWQDVDLKMGLPTLLQKQIPSGRHIILFLHVDIKTLYERVRNKHWWDEEDEAEGIEGFQSRLDRQLEYLRKLEKFEFYAIDSSNYEYKLIKFPYNFW